MESLLLVLTAGVCAFAAGVFARAARHRYRFLHRVERTHAGEGYDEEGQRAYEAAHTLAQFPASAGTHMPPFSIRP